MKFRLVTTIVLAFLFIQCDSEKNGNVADIEVGEITEKSAEEIESFVKYAPEFAFNSIDGNQVALSDLKGKFVYVDIWATWCKPCLDQIPAMKEMEAKYKDTDIEFVSISVDSDRDKAKWENMVREKAMSGLHLYAGRGSSFHQDYKISTIPKFLLIGKDGELISDNAPRPMDYRTRDLNQGLMDIFDDLLKQ